ncbi:hypothetical protein JZ751_027456 [Albula glossodonta]|uniref:Uncharacterized protein n=1 Tax=Albula glossodonta TaxID=121402 RepID=A0A8T2MVM4_9TELE|nr:hypothetical protein JZ751_027456 [Albula glossodonta]
MSFNLFRVEPLSAWNLARPPDEERWGEEQASLLLHLDCCQFLELFIRFITLIMYLPPPGGQTLRRCLRVRPESQGGAEVEQAQCLGMANEQLTVPISVMSADRGTGPEFSDRLRLWLWRYKKNLRDDKSQVYQSFNHTDLQGGPFTSVIRSGALRTISAQPSENSDCVIKREQEKCLEKMAEDDPANDPEFAVISLQPSGLSHIGGREEVRAARAWLIRPFNFSISCIITHCSEPAASTSTAGTAHLVKLVVSCGVEEPANRLCLKGESVPLFTCCLDRPVAGHSETGSQCAEGLSDQHRGGDSSAVCAILQEDRQTD